MAEEKPIVHSPQSELSRDDVSALEYVLRHVKGSSPSSFTPLTLEDLENVDA